MSRKLEPALRQYMSAPMHRPSGRPRWAYAIYAADGTLLDFIPWDTAIGWPQWVEELPQLAQVEVAAGEFDRWLKNAAASREEAAR
jgi:hypothetical protein